MLRKVATSTDMVVLMSTRVMMVMMMRRWDWGRVPRVMSVMVMMMMRRRLLLLLLSPVTGRFRVRRARLVLLFHSEALITVVVDVGARAALSCTTGDDGR